MFIVHRCVKPVFHLLLELRRRSGDEPASRPRLAPRAGDASRTCLAPSKKEPNPPQLISTQARAPPVKVRAALFSLQVQMPLARIRYPVRVLGHRVAVQCGRRARTPTRLLHSPAPRPDLASRINGAFSAYPRDSIACVLATEIASIYGSYQLLRWLDVDVPADFAVAFALARPLRRFRLPVELAGAVALSKAFPILPKIQVSRLSGALPRWVAAEAPSLLAALLPWRCHGAAAA